MSLEDAAETIRQYEQETVPGLLQTRAYAEAIHRLPPGWLDEQAVQRRVQARLQRQSLLTRPRAPRVEIVISEAVLRRVVSTRDLAAGQLQHLLDVTHRANVILRVLPWNVGMHSGMAVNGGFSLLRFPREPLTGEVLEPPLAYVETATAVTYLTKSVEVDVYDLAWDDLITRALNPAESRQPVTSLLKGMSP